MRLSSLQKYILLKTAEKGGKVDRKIFRMFYENLEKKPGKKYQEKIITKSLERLIDRGFITGFGKRTVRKWFITQISLTSKGRAAVKELLREKQRKLPFRKRTK